MIKPKTERVPKDVWDKVGIVFTGLAGIVTPTVIGLSVWAWNHERTTRDSAAQMVSIALGVLSEEPGENPGNDPLREWAVNVLMNPTEPPVLSADAAKSLLERKINVSDWGGWKAFTTPMPPTYNDKFIVEPYTPPGKGPFPEVVPQD